MSQSPLLEMKNISKTFGAVRALSNVSLTAHAGELHALMGENGAGKSTLMKVLSGAYTPDPGGAVVVDGKPVRSGDPEAIQAGGHRRHLYQELRSAPNLTVARQYFPWPRIRHDGAGRDRGTRTATQHWSCSVLACVPPDHVVGDLVARRAPTGRRLPAPMAAQRSRRGYGRAYDFALHR